MSQLVFNNSEDSRHPPHPPNLLLKCREALKVSVQHSWKAPTASAPPRPGVFSISELSGRNVQKNGNIPASTLQQPSLHKPTASPFGWASDIFVLLRFLFTSTLREIPPSPRFVICVGYFLSCLHKSSACAPLPSELWFTHPGFNTTFMYRFILCNFRAFCLDFVIRAFKNNRYFSVGASACHSISDGTREALFRKIRHRGQLLGFLKCAAGLGTALE